MGTSLKFPNHVLFTSIIERVLKLSVLEPEKKIKWGGEKQAVLSLRCKLDMGYKVLGGGLEI